MGTEQVTGRGWLLRSMFPRSRVTPLPVLFAIELGVATGVGSYTFSYAKGLSYFGTEPSACVNCHIMEPQYAGWQKPPLRGSLHRLIVELIDAIVAAKKGGASDAQLAPALALQHRAQWRLDFIAAENSMGFHAPQEAARVLAEAIDYARQGQLAALMPGASKPTDAAPVSATAPAAVPPAAAPGSATTTLEH